MPKRVKYRKHQRGSRKGFESRAVRVDFGEFGLQALERAWMTAKQIEAARVAIARFTKRRGKLWLRIFPDKGKGKGAPEFWVAVIRPGRIMFELGGVPEPLAKEAFRLAAGKLPIKTRFVSRIS
jgi:large subunit ribosomal protein L16